MTSRRAVFKKTIFVALSTLVSRALGAVRELLTMRFLGSGAAADAFIAAFTIPNSLRKIFAEGALSAAFLPTVVSVLRTQGKREAYALVTSVLFFVSSALLVLCIAGSRYAEWVVWCAAPGFGAEQLQYAANFLRILIFFIMAVSSTAIFTAALQAMQHFALPAYSQVVLNLLFIAELLAGIHYGWSFTTLAYCILGNGVVLIALHMFAYSYVGMAYVLPTRHTARDLLSVMRKFIPCVVTVGSVEISLIIDRQMASFLPEGSVALLYYAHGLLRLPISLFAIAFSTILLPYISRVALYAPSRIRYYLFESTKFVLWITVPTMLLMMVFAYPLFFTLLLSESFPVSSVLVASHLLIGFAAGLPFFSFNKVVLTLFYAQHDTLTPTLVTLVGAIANTLGNYILMQFFGVTGIVAATSAAAALQSMLFIFLLQRQHGVLFYGKRLVRFFILSLLQLAFFGILLYLCFSGVYALVWRCIPGWAEFFIQGKGLWLWLVPLCAGMGMLMYLTRTLFGIRICFVD